MKPGKLTSLSLLIMKWAKALHVNLMETRHCCSSLAHQFRLITRMSGQPYLHGRTGQLLKYMESKVVVLTGKVMYRICCVTEQASLRGLGRSCCFYMEISVPDTLRKAAD